jgi:hypothetical protein
MVTPIVDLAVNAFAVRRTTWSHQTSKEKREVFFKKESIFRV